jgi:iron complex transport system substrate-binding protein
MADVYADRFTVAGMGKDFTTNLGLNYQGVMTLGLVIVALVSAVVLVTNAGNIGVYGPDSRIAWIFNELAIPSAMADIKDGDHGGDSVSFEFILERNPDWLFVVDRDAGTGENTGAAAALLDNELVNQTNAAKAGHIVYLDPQAAYITMHGYTGLMLMLDQVIAGLNA